MRLLLSQKMPPAHNRVVAGSYPAGPIAPCPNHPNVWFISIAPKYVDSSLHQPVTDCLLYDPMVDRTLGFPDYAVSIEEGPGSDLLMNVHSSGINSPFLVRVYSVLGYRFCNPE